MKTTKIQAGHYRYRAHDICKVRNHWRIFDEDGADVTSNTWGFKTLDTSREMIDLAIERATQAEELLSNDRALAKAFEVDHPTIKDIAQQVTKWGKISDNQRSLVLRIAENEEREVGTVAESGAARVVGRVLSCKWKYGTYGEQLKMLLQLANGAKLYGTCPADLDEDIVGKIVGVDVSKVNASDRDAAFGFFSRPRNGEVDAATDLAQFLYEEGRIGFDVYEAVQLACSPAADTFEHGRFTGACFADGEVRVFADGTVEVEYDDERDDVTLQEVAR